MSSTMEGGLYKAVKVRRLVDDLRADPAPPINNLSPRGDTGGFLKK